MKKILIAMLFVGIPLLVKGQMTAFQAKTFTGESGAKLQYRMLLPQNYDSTKTYPLVLFLHGAGERGSDNYRQLKWGVAHFADPTFRKKYPAFVVAPQVPKRQTWSTLSLDRDSSVFTVPMPQPAAEPMQLTMALLERLQNNYAIDEQRLYVTGLSMGGLGTFDVIERFPHKFAAAVPISGGGDITRAFLLKGMPIWVFHGAKDHVVDVRYSRAMVRAIQTAGGSPGFTEYPDAGHVEAWVQAYNNPLLYEWMFSKKRD